MNTHLYFSLENRTRVLPSFLVQSAALLPAMVSQDSGHIVNVSSLNALLPTPHRAAYTASKSALQGFSDSVRAEHADDGIRVTVVSPGYVATEMSKKALSGDGAIIGGT